MGAKRKTERAPLTPQEIDLQNRQIDLADQQIALINQQAPAVDDFLGFAQQLLQPQLELIQQELDLGTSPEAAALLQNQIDFANSELDAIDAQRTTRTDLVRQSFDFIQSGGEATQRQRELIAAGADAAIARGESDIDRQLARTAEVIRSEIAPSRGLRVTDTPIFDQLDRAAEEATRGKANLVETIRGQQAQQDLQFPLQAGAVIAQANQGQQSILGDQAQFQQQLKEVAAQNRTGLTGTIGDIINQTPQFGLNLANISRPPFSFAPVATESTQKQGVANTFSTVLGGIGGLLRGTGAVTNQ